MSITTDLVTLTEDAVMAWIQNVSAHGQDTGITPRRWSQSKFDQAGDLDTITLPALVVRAMREQQLHTKVAVYRFTVDTWLYMQADDTDTAAWDAMTAKLETIFSVDDLAGYLNASESAYSCRGIVSRMVGDKMTETRQWRVPYRIVLWASQQP